MAILVVVLFFSLFAGVWAFIKKIKIKIVLLCCRSGSSSIFVGPVAQYLSVNNR